MRVHPFTWGFLDAEGRPTGRSQAFPSRQEAEAWLGESWQELLGRGVEEVQLLEDDVPVYRMGLREG